MADYIVCEDCRRTTSGRCSRHSSFTIPMTSPPTPEGESRADDATAQLLIELAFLVPKGTDFRTHPISKRLIEYRDAVVTAERTSREARVDELEQGREELLDEANRATEAFDAALEESQARAQQMREALAWVEAYYGDVMVEAGCPCEGEKKCPLHAALSEGAQ